MKLQKFAIPIIFTLAIIFRFVNFENRWGLGYDQASFAIVGKYAIDAFQLPLLGPFSSGGPFQTGGMWYWVIMVGNIFFPGRVEGPWIFMGVLSVSLVGTMITIGTLLGGTPLGLISGLLTAISTAQITQSTNLSNQTPIALPAALSLLASLVYIKTKKPVYLLFLGLGVGTASAIHLQGLGLFPLIITTLIFGGTPALRGIFLLCLGLIAPWISVLYADAGNHWYNTQNMIYYYTVDQYNISLDVLGRRWLTFVKEFIPSVWGFTIGGYRWVGATTIIVGIILATHSFCIRLIRPRLTLLPPLQGEALRRWLLVITSFMGMVVVVRYAHVPLYDSFVVFFHPFILLLTAGLAAYLFRIRTILGILFLLFLVIPSMIKNTEEISHATNLTARDAKSWRNTLTQTYPNEKFAVYDYYYYTAAKTLPLLLYLDEQNLLDPHGHRIGITTKGISDLESSTSAELLEDHWAYLDFNVVYESVQHWSSRLSK